MSANVHFLTEAGEGTGYGHVSRSTALADGFESFKCEVSFTIRGTDHSVIDSRSFSEVNKEWFDEPYIESIASENEIIVVDSYKISDEMLNFISMKANTPVFLMDSQLKHGDQGVLLFPTVYAGDYSFEESNQLRILSGISYLLFTKELWEPPGFTVNKKVRNAGISLGSSSLKAVDIIIKRLTSQYPGLETICIFGNLDVKGMMSYSIIKVDVTGRLHKSKYVEKLQSIDLLISNGGQTLNEALLIGLPVIPLITADNQVKNVAGWEKQKVVSGLDVRSGFSPDAFIDKLRVFRDYAARKTFHEKCRQIIHSKGAIRAAKAILNLGQI